jgi:flavin-dependent dehydrogenase
MENRPVVIVGSGPAGTAAALSLHRRAPELARNIVVLDKARHPRPKVCAGGVIPAGRTWLEEHDVAFDMPHVAVHRALARTPGATVEYGERNFCYVVRRNEFDAALASACRERGIEIREDEPVRRLARDAGVVVVETDRARYRTPLVIGADGSGSTVRRQLVEGGGSDTVARAAMCDVPIGVGGWDGFSAQRYEFDFSDVPRGLAGYRWSFPCLIDGAPHANVGVFSLTRGAALIKEAMAAELARHGAEGARHVAFPIRWYRRGVTRVSADNVILAGDAAGADPLMGEGISLALEYGSYAAAAAIEAVRSGDYSGAAYQRRIDESWLGIKLGRLHATARWFYSRYWRLCFALPERSVRLRTLGLRWYNGIDDWDRRSVFAAARALVRPGFTAPRVGDGGS